MQRQCRHLGERTSKELGKEPGTRLGTPSSEKELWRPHTGRRRPATFVSLTTKLSALTTGISLSYLASIPFPKSQLGSKASS